MYVLNQHQCVRLFPFFFSSNINLVCLDMNSLIGIKFHIFKFCKTHKVNLRIGYWCALKTVASFYRLKAQFAFLYLTMVHYGNVRILWESNRQTVECISFRYLLLINAFFSIQFKGKELYQKIHLKLCEDVLRYLIEWDSSTDCNFH